MNESLNQETTKPSEALTRPRSPRLKPTFTTEEAVRLMIRGYSYTDIAAKFKVTTSAISYRLQAYTHLVDVDGIAAMKKARVDLLTATETRLLIAMNDPVKIEKASLNNLAYAYSQMHNARRIEQGLATSIVDTTINNMALTDLITRRDILMAQLKSIAAPSSPDTEQPRRTIDVTPDTPELT